MATRLKKGSKAARDYMAKIRGMKKSAPKKKAAPRKKPRTVGKATGQPSLFDRMNNDYQTGTSNKEYDRKRVALPPGVRKSKETGNKYTERRANRSDRGNSLLGIKYDSLGSAIRLRSDIEKNILQNTKALKSLSLIKIKDRLPIHKAAILKYRLNVQSLKKSLIIQNQLIKKLI